MLEPLYIAASTACGKTALAISLAEKIKGEIINADAFQLYAGIPVCTAQPTEEESTRVPHHLFGSLSPTQASNAGQYQKLAQQKIQEVQSRGHRPIIVGGSGLYLKALTTGLAELPRADLKLREELALRSAEERVQWLLRLDPNAAENVPLSNDRYVSRALEICLLTGQPQSELRQNWQKQHRPFFGVLLVRSKEELWQRIYNRVDAMIANGLVDEVRLLLQRHGLSPAAANDSVLQECFPTAHQAIGIKQIIAYLRDELTLPEAVEQMKLITRQYAKRQSTWFRREKGFHIINVQAETAQKVLIEAVKAMLK